MGHVACVFAGPGWFRMKINSVDQDTHRSRFGGDRQNAIATPETISKPQHREENKSGEQHKKGGQERIS